LLILYALSRAHGCYCWWNWESRLHRCPFSLHILHHLCDLRCRKYSVMIIDEESLPYTSVKSSYREKSKLCSITFAMIALYALLGARIRMRRRLRIVMKYHSSLHSFLSRYLRIFLQLDWLQFARRAAFWSWLN
jgi:hypothetical protein